MPYATLSAPGSLIREGHDIVIVAELMGHKRLDQTRRYSLPSQADREKAILSLPTDHRPLTADRQQRASLKIYCRFPAYSGRPRT